MKTHSHQNRSSSSKRMVSRIHWLLFVLLIVLVQDATFAQDSLRRRYAALGFRVGRDLIAQLNTPNPSGLLVNIDPLSYLRLECTFGMNNQTREETIQLQNGSGVYDTEFELESKMRTLGLGLFLQHRLQRTNFYLGYRRTTAELSSEWLESDYQYDPVLGPLQTAHKETDKSSYVIHSVALGCEHFLADRFSVGGELAFNSGKASHRSGGESEQAWMKYTDATLVLRFYPF